MFRCVLCGTSLHWYSDFNLDECYPDEAMYDSGAVGMYHCPNCNIDYEITTYDEQLQTRIILLPCVDEEEEQ